MNSKCVWAREGVAVESCPVSYISADSYSFLEEFHASKLFGYPNMYDLPARTAEAFFVLETELRLEHQRGQE